MAKKIFGHLFATKQRSDAGAVILKKFTKPVLVSLLAISKHTEELARWSLGNKNAKGITISMIPFAQIFYLLVFQVCRIIFTCQNLDGCNDDP